MGLVEKDNYAWKEIVKMLVLLLEIVPLFEL
ncbi:MAG: hypothetical protein JWO58_2293 [Chitinophagaceae bacterium]|nr:hypothetical protein [Chitinophagaceae bacterium]